MKICRLLIALSMICLILNLAACGKKGPPALKQMSNIEYSNERIKDRG